MAEQAGAQGVDLRAIRGAERADQEAIRQRLAPVTWIAPQPFRDHDINLALEQFVQVRRLAEANGYLWLGLAKLRQPRPQPIDNEIRMDPNMQQAGNALGPEFGRGVREATKRLAYLR